MRRQSLGIGLFAATMAAIAVVGSVPQGPTLVAADAKSEAALKNQVSNLQTQLATAQQQIAQLNATIMQLKAAPKNPPADPQKKTLLAMKNAPYVHDVALKLKKDSPTEEVQSVLADLPALSKIATVRGIWFGVPAAIASPDAVSNYDVGVTVLFDNAAGMQAYYADDIHKAFVLKHLKYWETPLIHDYSAPASP